MTNIFLKNTKETLLTKKSNNTLQVNLGPLCTFSLTQKQSFPTADVCVSDRFWPKTSVRE